MTRFFIQPKEAKEGLVLLNEKESHHAISVLRLKPGDLVDLFDGKGGSFEGVVAGVRDKRLSVMLNKNKTNSRKFSVKITLVCSVIKPDRMDLLIQKSSELGVAAIVPVLSDRSIIKISKERWESKVSRWRKIVQEACKQCGQTLVPDVSPVQTFKAFVENLKMDSDQLILIPTLARKGRGFYEALKTRHAKNIVVFIGPEGDFTETEVEAAISKGAVPIDLGPLVMRSETACFYAASVLNFFYREVSSEKS